MDKSQRPRRTGPISRIPVELQEMVLEQVQNDNESLIQCSLVCRLWAHSCRRRLFHTLRITPDSSDKFFKSFRQFLKKKPAIRDYVVRLELCGSPPSDMPFKSYTVRRQHCVHQDMLVPVLQGLPKLAEVHLSHVKFLGSKQRGATYGFRLSKLEIEHTGDSRSMVEDLLRVLGLFDHISFLRLHDLDFCVPINEETEREKYGSLGTTIEQLDVGSLHPLVQMRLLYIISNSTSVGCLTSLRLGEIGVEEELVALSSLLHEAGAQLQELALSMWALSATLTPAETSKLQVDACVNLKKFEAVIRYEMFEDSNDAQRANLAAWKGHVEILQKMSKSLECIRLRLVIWENDFDWLNDFAATDWASLGEVIEQSSRLETLEFAFQDERENRDPPVEDFIKTVKKMLPGACAREILQYVELPRETPIMTAVPLAFLYG